MSGSDLVGLVVGTLLGILSGAVFDVLFLLALRASHGWQAGVAVCGKIVGLIFLWGGSQWLTSGPLFTVPDRQSMIYWYWGALLVAFMVCVWWPLFQGIRQIGRAMGK